MTTVAVLGFHAAVFISVAVLIGVGDSLASAPDWAMKNTQRIQGSVLSVVCSGTGPSIDLARADAVSSCQGSAVRQLQTTVDAYAVSIETEHDVAFHQQIEQRGRFHGLTCKPEKEEVEQTEDGRTLLYLLCQFDLSRVKKAPETHDESGGDRQAIEPKSLETKATGLKSIKTARGRYLTGKKTILTVAAVPACDEILVQGTRPRPVRCNSNPMSFEIDEGDVQIIVRSRGYQPKTIVLKSEGRTLNETLQILLDR